MCINDDQLTSMEYLVILWLLYHFILVNTHEVAERYIVIHWARKHQPGQGFWQVTHIQKRWIDVFMFKCENNIQSTFKKNYLMTNINHTTCCISIDQSLKITSLANVESCEWIWHIDTAWPCEQIYYDMVMLHDLVSGCDMVMSHDLVTWWCYMTLWVDVTWCCQITLWVYVTCWCHMTLSVDVTW